MMTWTYVKADRRGNPSGAPADAGEVVVSLCESGSKVRGRGADTAIIVAPAKARLDAINTMAIGHEEPFNHSIKEEPV